ncbi:MAG: hypothetical protein ACK4K3_07385 [Aquabacterium sp.]
MSYNVHLALKSSNVKTGPIPVSTTTRNTCPTSCGVREACYAASGRLAIHWRAVTEGKRGGSWGEFVAQVEALPEGQLWRHNQAGDLPGDGERIDRPALRELVKANKGKKGFTYTHYPMDEVVNRGAVAEANAQGFTVNLSANDLDHADELAGYGFAPVVVVLPMDAPKKLQTPQGRTVVTCPATYREDVTCATCALCQKAQRTTIVGFPAHGTNKKKADAIARKVIPIKAA